MVNAASFNSNVEQLKISLEELQENVTSNGYTEESVKKLGSALADMNEEVQLLQNIMQLGKPKGF